MAVPHPRHIDHPGATALLSPSLSTCAASVWAPRTDTTATSSPRSKSWRGGGRGHRRPGEDDQVRQG
jgi:hypothetical protein